MEKIDKKVKREKCKQMVRRKREEQKKNHEKPGRGKERKRSKREKKERQRKKRVFKYFAHKTNNKKWIVDRMVKHHASLPQQAKEI